MLLSVPKMAKHTGIPYGTLNRLVNEGKVPAVYLPGRVQALLDTEDIESLITASKVASKEEEQCAKVPLNTKRLKSLTAVKNGDKYQWVERYAGKRH